MGCGEGGEGGEGARFALGSVVVGPSVSGMGGVPSHVADTVNVAVYHTSGALSLLLICSRAGLGLSSRLMT